MNELMIHICPCRKLLQQTHKREEEENEEK